MKRITSIFLGALLAATPVAHAQDIEDGLDLYRSHCATCHGIDATGSGPMAGALLIRPPDLTVLASQNGGTFPIARVVMRIDGRDPLVSHGSPMPVYGDFFEVDDTPMKSETGQPIMTSSPVIDLVAYLMELQNP